MAIKTYTVRLDEQTKEQAQQIFSELGMDFSTGIRIYLNQVVQHNGIPFALNQDDSKQKGGK